MMIFSTVLKSSLAEMLRRLLGQGLVVTDASVTVHNNNNVGLKTNLNNTQIKVTGMI